MSERSIQECPRCDGNRTVPDIVYNRDGTDAGRWSGYEKVCPKCGGSGIARLEGK